MQTTATIEQLNAALNAVNAKYDNNIIFKSGPEGISAKRRRFTLTVKRSQDAGGRLSHQGRRVAAACWHVHGDFFEYLFDDGVELIKAGTKSMKDNYDNWQDWNIGSIAQPMYYSEACNC